jgi:hypothetical protein
VDDQRLDERQMPEYPEGVVASRRRREDHRVLPHVFDAGQDAVPALVQVVADEVDALHGFLPQPGCRLLRHVFTQANVV